MNPSNYLWDENGTRYQCIQCNGAHAYNWLFFPGGPGADSRYLTSLIQEIATLPGNVWFIDFPGNGDNTRFTKPEFDFEKWSECFNDAVKMFPNPICVGHSFGGMFPLLFPQLEHILKGFVILNSAPSIWMEEAAKKTVEKGLPNVAEPMKAFEINPNPQTFHTALMACMPYYFPKESLERGKKILESAPFNYHPAAWWLNKVIQTNFTAKWVPEKVPTLILGGTEDCITPSILFERDARFKRHNITSQVIPNAGHLPWVEKPQEVRKAFLAFIDRHLNHNHNKK